MLRYPQVDKTIPLEDAAFLAQSFVNYFKGLEKIKDFYIRIQEDFLKSVNITKENRKTQESFKCVKCSFEQNADENASKIIKKRGQSLIGRV